MTKKVGRNDDCPCGSGKKYKRCCLNAQVNPTLFKTSQPQTIFNTYNSIDLLRTFSAMTLSPQNHGKNVRLELLTSLTLQSFNAIELVVPLKTLSEYMDKEHASNHFEDPSINLFTDLITFYGGDYLILPGISETGSFILSNLLAAIYNWPNSGIPEEYKNNCTHAALFILNISNIVCKKIGLTRYQKSNAENDLLFLSNVQKLSDLKSAISFSDTEIHTLMEENSISEGAIQGFLLDLNDPAIGNQYIEESPLLARPFIHYKNEYILVSPATLSYALTDFLWNHSKIWACEDEVNNAYHDVIWNNTQMHLKRMGFTRIDIDAIQYDQSLSIKEDIYQFDDDKLAYVQYVFDNGQKVTPENGLNYPSINSRKQDVINKLWVIPDYANYRFLDLTLVSSIGRIFLVPMMQVEHARSIGIHINEFEILYQLKDYNGLDLWKFATARDEQLIEPPFLGFSFLDQFKIYLDNGESFYLSDKTKYHFLSIEPGYSAELVQKAKLLSDNHSALRFIHDRIASVPVIKKSKYAPVYYSESDLGHEIQFLVEGYFQPIWITPSKKIKNLSPGLIRIYVEMLDAIAYWIWQVAELISGDLKELGDLPITITFELNPEEKFDPIDRQFDRGPALSQKFIVEIKDSTFHIIIPFEINSYLYGADNQGERILLRQLLDGLNQLLASKVKKRITEERLNEVVELSAPLGNKKKIFILDTSDNLLTDPTNLVDYRYVQEYDVNVVLNSIVPGLGNKCPAIGEITTKEKKIALTRDIVIRVLLPMLKKTVNQYDAEILIKRLIGLNEALIHKREDIRIKTPTRIACFVSEEQQTKDLQESLSNLNRTIIAIRCLIEHIVAESPTGKNILSTTGVDELVAIMDQIISWGSLGDQINFDLFDIKMGILPSGRVGTEKKFQSEVLDPYYKSKTIEDVFDAKATFEQVFPQLLINDDKDVPEHLDKSFNDEFGISFTRICNFINDIGISAYQQKTPFGCLNKSEMFEEVNRYDHSFSKEEFDNAITFLTLFNRGKVENIPDGYDSFDISPWRFNRRLSLLRRPLVALNDPSSPDNPIMYWGFRQLLSSRVYFQEQCESGRFKCIEGGPVQNVLGKFANKKGTSLLLSVLSEVGSQGLIIDSELFIGPNHLFKNDKDIGDIDVLLIDQTAKTIYSLECKSMAPSRNIKEMVEEVSKLFGSESEKGWIQKHVERHIWIEANLDQLSIKYKIDLSEYEVQSFMVTREDMLTPYLKNRKSDLPFITLYELKEIGMAALKN